MADCICCSMLLIEEKTSLTLLIQGLMADSERGLICAIRRETDVSVETTFHGPVIESRATALREAKAFWVSGRLAPCWAGLPEGSYEGGRCDRPAPGRRASPPPRARAVRRPVRFAPAHCARLGSIGRRPLRIGLPQHE